ncbi:unnamed protein product, partial [marine sediment metagenome]
GRGFWAGESLYRYAHVDAEGLIRAAYGVFPKIYYGETGVPTVLAPAGTVTVTLTAVANVALNQFAGGILSKAGGGGGGYGVNYRIKSNTQATAGNPFTVTLHDKIIADIPVTDTCTLFRSKWANVVCMAVRIAGGVVTDLSKTAVVGVPNRPVPADNCCWLQVKGPCMVVPAGGAEGVADNERMMAFQEDGVVTRARYEVAGVLDMQIAGWVLPITTAGAIPDLLEIDLQLE